MFRMHAGSRAEPVLAAWGIDTAGKPVFVGLAPDGAESTDAWTDFLDDLKHRGLRDPLLIISDGAAGLGRADEEVGCRPVAWSAPDSRVLVRRAGTGPSCMSGSPTTSSCSMTTNSTPYSPKARRCPARGMAPSTGSGPASTTR
jgi:mutator family transposase